MEALFFALWTFFLPNPYHPGEAYMVPIPMGIEAYVQADKFPSITEADITTVIIAEHGGGFPYPADSRECPKEKVFSEKKQKTIKRCKRNDDGEIKYIAWGLMQISKGEIKKYNKAFGTAYTTEPLPFMYRFTSIHLWPKANTVMDWRTNIEVGAFTISEIKRRHATKKRCTSKVEQCTTVLNEDGSLGANCKKVKRFHNWHSHYRCGVNIRDEMFWDKEDQQWEPRCKTSYRVRLVKGFSKWEKSWENFQLVFKQPKPDIIVSSEIEPKDEPEKLAKEDGPDVNRKKKTALLRRLMSQ